MQAAEYRRFMTAIVKSFMSILGSEVAIRRALKAGDFIIANNGEVIGVPGYPGYALAQLIRAYTELSGHAAISTIIEIIKRENINLSQIELPPEIQSEVAGVLVPQGV